MTPEELLDLENWLSKNELIPIEPPKRAVETGPNPFVSLPPEVAVIARSSAGWSIDPIDWEIRLRSDGFLDQERTARVGDRPQTETHRAFVGPEWVQMFLRRADELDFWDLTYEVVMVVTDAGSEFLAIRSGEKWRAWNPKAVYFHAREGHEGAQKFMELWKLISAQAPFS